jgi:hypothetical protein
MRMDSRWRIPTILALALIGCAEQLPQKVGTERMRVEVRLPNGDPAPGAADPPLPLTLEPVELSLTVEAMNADGSRDQEFDGWVRISVEPGSVLGLSGSRARGRSLELEQGLAENQLIRIGNPRGLVRIWAEDIGYQPADNPFEPAPACSNGIDDDGDGLRDFPDDPGCAFANDDSETGGSHATGASGPVHFERPRLADLQGLGARSPYDQEGVEVETAPLDARQCEGVIVTRIAADGFYATDTCETRGYGHIFAFTFNTPGGLRVCDRVTELSGTSTEFFGFTELSFPSFERHAWRFPFQDDLRDGPCRIPDPVLIGPGINPEQDTALEPVEAALVRIENVRVGRYFGPEIKTRDSNFGPERSNCDRDGNGVIDFVTPGSEEAECANACGAEPDCVEWTGYVSRGNYRVVFPAVNCRAGGGERPCSMQINTRAIAQFDPPAMRGKTIRSLTGTLRNFSGGQLNWTIEARCSADLVCDEPSQNACVSGPKEPQSSQTACVFPRTIHDPDEATN